MRQPLELILKLFLYLFCAAKPRKINTKKYFLDRSLASRPGLLTFLVLALVISLSPARVIAAQSPPEPFDCASTPTLDALTELTTRDNWATWIARLSGAQDVVIDGEKTFIQTRYSPSMFSGQTNARAYAYVLEQVRAWYPPWQIEEDAFTYDGQTWKNLVIDLPGAGSPEEVIILSAHLNSVSQDPERLTPGAADNASGASALLEAARVFRHYRFERSLRLIWFTGEEQGMIGSKAYVRDHKLDGILGVINMDMFGYDADHDGCFELHVGTLPQSAQLGACFRAALEAYQPGLQVDYLNGYNMGFSDHSSFWDQGIGALEVLENFSYNGAQNGCQGARDRNPDYHRTTDTIEKLDLDHGFAVAQASLAAGAGMAQPLEACFTGFHNCPRRPPQGKPA